MWFLRNAYLVLLGNFCLIKYIVIGISTDDDAHAALMFIKESKITFSQYIDSNVRLENMLGANTIPLTILVDAQGRVLKKIRGSQVWDSPKSLAMISKVFQINLN